MWSKSPGMPHPQACSYPPHTSIFAHLRTNFYGSLIFVHTPFLSRNFFAPKSFTHTHLEFSRFPAFFDELIFPSKFVLFMCQSIFHIKAMSSNGTLGDDKDATSNVSLDVGHSVTAANKKRKPNVTNLTTTSIIEEYAPSNKKRRERKVKDLPSELSLLDDKDREKFVLVLEGDNNPKSQYYKKEFLVAVRSN
jgi:hypothetical protein